MSSKARKVERAAQLKRDILTWARAAGEDLDEAALCAAFDQVLYVCQRARMFAGQFNRHLDRSWQHIAFNTTRSNAHGRRFAW